jgi:calcium-dependent protein kinase
MGACFGDRKKNYIVVEKITVQKRLSDRKGSIHLSNIHRNRSSIYVANNEDISKRYIFLEQLGAGYFGTVKMVSPRNDLNKKFACKSIDKSKLTNKKINNLIREIETLSIVDHPNIIKYYETYNDNRYFHIIMEFCTGGELFERILKQQHFSEQEACDLVFKITSAIHHCHELKIVHRDLKPENILFESKTSFSDIKIIDFGLSRKVIKEDDLHSVVGSPFYVAPEVLDGNYDSKCDIWSIGVITFCLLSGRPPFYSQNKEELFEKIKSSNVEFKSKIWEEISSEAKEFIKALLNKNPNKRPCARKVLNHPWLKKFMNEDFHLNNLDPEILSRIRKFQEPRLLTKAVINFIVKSLNTSEIQQLKTAFNIIDSERTGFIDLKGLKNSFEYCKIDIKDDEIDQIWKRLIANSKKPMDKINYSSFIAAAMDRKRLINKTLLWEAFKMFDSDQKGYISIFNIEKSIERTGKKKDFNDFELMFKELGLSLDDVINFEDFCKIIEKDL